MLTNFEYLIRLGMDYYNNISDTANLGLGIISV